MLIISPLTLIYISSQAGRPSQEISRLEGEEQYQQEPHMVEVEEEVVEVVEDVEVEVEERHIMVASRHCASEGGVRCSQDCLTGSLSVPPGGLLCSASS